MCSSTLGPATTPSFVTWPTTKMAMPRLLAICISMAVDSLTWLTLPGAEETSSRYMVWMESMTAIWGIDLSMACSIRSRLVSHRKRRSPVTGPIRFALILICFRDSSPDMYSTFCPAPARCLHT